MICGIVLCVYACSHVDFNLAATFADQYSSSWSWAHGHDVTRHTNATLIRLPLSTNPSLHSQQLSQPGGNAATLPIRQQGVAKAPLGWNTASLASVQKALESWGNAASRQLLFCKKLQVGHQQML